MDSIKDAATQTTASSLAPTLPLPLQYPVNLIYAQSMLSICLSQQQCVDLNIAQLRFYLRQHERLALASAQTLKKTSPAQSPGVESLSTVSCGVTCAGCSAAHAAQRNADTNAPVDQAHLAAGAPNAAAQAPAAAQPAPAEPNQIQRRLAAALKLAIVMVLLEVRAVWFILYFFGVLLYIGGLFDPFIELFQRQSAETTLDQRLTELRNRQRQEAATTPTGSTTQNQDSIPRHAVDGQTNNTQPRQNQEDSEHTTNSTEGSQMEQNLTPDAAPSNSSESREAEAVSLEQLSRSAGEPEEQTAAGRVEGTAAAEGEGANQGPNEAQPRWAHRFIYQLFVMFFMTLLPWWSPNPRYL